jgi:rubrerythrin
MALHAGGFTMPEQGHTGTDDVSFNLVSVLYHTLQEAETMEKYIRDAEASGDQDVITFFREIQDANRRRSERAKQLLQRTLR